MSNKNYRTLDGLYKALERILNNSLSEYRIEKNDADLAIFSAINGYDVIANFAIETLLPILKRAVWMVRRNNIKDRMELLVWIDNDNK